jgi:hypothetical protein
MVEVTAPVENFFPPIAKSCMVSTFLPALRPIIRLRAKKIANKIKSAESLKLTASIERTSENMADKFYLTRGPKVSKYNKG